MSKRPVNVSVTPRGKYDNAQRMIKRFMKKVKKYRVLEKHRETLRYQKPSEKRARAEKKRQKVLDKLKAEEKKYMEADFEALPKPKKKRRR
jgi:ribosomal protein S21